MSKVVASAIAGALTLSTAGGLSVAKVLDRDEVTISVDGVSQQVKVKPGTVAQALEAQDIKVGAHDSVQPTLDSKVEDGGVITVAYGRPVTMTIDGKKVTRWTTATSVSEVLSQFNLDDPKGRLSVSRSMGISRQGLAFSIQTPKDVTVSANGKTTKVSLVGTVADALKAAKISYDKNDVTTPGLNTVLKDGMSITLKRVDTKTEQREVAIKHGAKTVKDSGLEKGKTKIKTKGVNGAKVETWVVTYTDGKKTGEKKTDTKVTTKPVDEVKLIGTKEKPAPKAQSAAKDQSASKTPSKGSGGSPVSGGTQCTASTYGAGDGTAGGPTASGETFNPNAMTAAHKTLPLGSVIRVTNVANGKTVTVRINDRGPYVGGRCLDLSTAAMNAIAPGQGLVTVRYA